MALFVQKYGGTSVGSVERLRSVAERIAATQQQGHQVVVVVSAMGHETDRLIELARALQRHPDPREYAILVTAGEQISSALLTMALMNLGCLARSYSGSQIPILTDNTYEVAEIKHVDTRRISEDIAKGCIPIVAGFQGLSQYGNLTTLGRGGSDATAVALAAALGADECQIYTDVDGVYNKDPNIYPDALLLPEISYQDMLAMANAGARVLQKKAVEIAGQYRVPLRVLSSFKENQGTKLIYCD